MKYFKIPCALILFLLLNCHDEPVDNTKLIIEVEDSNLIFEDFNGEQYYMGGGCTNGSPDYSIVENILEDLEIPSNLPSEFDLSEFLPPVRSQGSQGSCTSWAISYYMKSMQEKIQSDLPYSSATILSPAYTYNQITQGSCSGTALSTTLEILKEKGLCSWAALPYTDSDCAIQPNEAQHTEATNNKISDYKGLSGENLVAEMKTLLTQQTSIIISTTISQAFGKSDGFGEAAYREHVVNYSETGCHTMLVVGYSDFNNAFKVVNSWGTDWGNAGFVWIDYKAFENVSDITAAFRVINGAYIAYDAED